MSRAKPHAPKAVEPPPAAAPADPAACADCRHWRACGTRDTGRTVPDPADPAGPLAPVAVPVGRCTAGPPTIPAKATAYGPLCLYPVTDADTPACARAEPK